MMVHYLSKNRFIALVSLSSMCSFVWLPMAQATTIIEHQDTSVATNLGLFGGQAEDIATDPTSDAVYFASMSPNGLFSSTDSGDHWIGLPTDVNYGTGKAVEVDPDTGRAFAIIGDSVLRSDDFGTTWDDKTSALDHPILGEDLLFAQHRLVVARDDGSVSVSEDDGDTFVNHTITSGDRITSLAAAEGNDVYYAVTTTGSVDTLYQSTDGGSTWTDMNVTSHGVASDGRVFEIGVDPLDDNHLVLISNIFGYPPYQSVDAGATWTEMTDISGTNVTFDSTGRLYIGSSYTDDATAFPIVWNDLTTDTPNSTLYADTFAVDGDQTDVLYTNSSYGVARSEDRGLSWEDLVSGVTAVKVLDMSQTTDKDTVWLGANGGLAKTDNFTDTHPTWEYPILPAPGLSNIRAVWVKPDDANIVVMGDGTFFFYSTDAGVTWHQSSSPTFSGNVQDIVQSHLDANTLYAIYWNDDLGGTDVGGAFISTDAGQTWTDLELPGDLPAISMALAADDTLYVGIGGDATTTGIYTYSASTWSLLANSPQTNDITSLLTDPSDVNTIWATTEADSTAGRFYTSVDAGATWTHTSTGLEDLNHLDTLTLKSSTSTMFMSGQDASSLNGVVYKSTDQGNSWSLFYTGERQETFYAMLFDGLLLGNDRGLYSLQSKATLHLKGSDSTIALNEVLTLRLTLKDAATLKLLKQKTVKILRKIGKNGEWKVFDTLRTDVNGKASLTVTPHKNTKYKARWTPGSSDESEYLTIKSSVFQVSFK